MGMEAFAQNSRPELNSTKNNKEQKRIFKSIPRQSVAADLRLETVKDVLQSRARRERFESIVRSSMYFRYLSDAVDLRDEYDYLFEEENIAEKLVIYETARMFGKKLQGTPIFEYYKGILNQLKKLKDRTTVTIGKTSSGSYDIDSGKDSDEAFLKFKMHVSAARGIEPRLHFSEKLVLRHDLFRQETLLEYRHNF